MLGHGPIGNGPISGSGDRRSLPLKDQRKPRPRPEPKDAA